MKDIPNVVIYNDDFRLGNVRDMVRGLRADGMPPEQLQIVLENFGMLKEHTKNTQKGQI